jgi:K+-sensing histidine kinase KdpD
MGGSFICALPRIFSAFGLGFQGGFLMRKSTDCLLGLKPWSLSAFVVALLAVVFATAMQEALTLLGATLHFATFLPAILAASLLAGVPAGAFAATLTIPIVWWAFIPPHFEFNPLTVADYNSFFLFLLLSSLAIWLSCLTREVLLISRN